MHCNTMFCVSVNVSFSMFGILLVLQTNNHIRCLKIFIDLIDLCFDLMYQFCRVGPYWLGICIDQNMAVNVLLKFCFVNLYRLTMMGQGFVVCSRYNNI